MEILATLQTGYGFWSPVAWLVGFIVAVIIAYLIWRMGEDRYKPGTEQAKPYISGNAEPAKGAVHVRASNLYWGYLQALKGYYGTVVPAHTGVLTDYMIWFVAVTALLLIIVGGLP